MGAARLDRRAAGTIALPRLGPRRSATASRPSASIELAGATRWPRAPTPVCVAATRGCEKMPMTKKSPAWSALSKGSLRGMRRSGMATRSGCGR